MTDLMSEILLGCQELTQQLHDQVTKRLHELNAREQRLIGLDADGLLTRGKILGRKGDIQMERARLQVQLADTSAELAAGAAPSGKGLSCYEIRFPRTGK